MLLLAFLGGLVAGLLVALAVVATRRLVSAPPGRYPTSDPFMGMSDLLRTRPDDFWVSVTTTPVYGAPDAQRPPC